MYLEINTSCNCSSPVKKKKREKNYAYKGTIISLCPNVDFEPVQSILTGLCPGGSVSCGHSAPEPGPGDCVPIWSWPRYWPRSEPSETQTRTHTHTHRSDSVMVCCHEHVLLKSV